ncbi:hypothetical protein [Inquilinus limosus]|uniref:Uncharacterized protein n=1 Tax=Inquilinus limosus TaxID=171674 RepID=A0A211YS93_9PROT|nr:hypothetical protein [Inquilinus limosus]OWJ55880.1 hypothetical protein BWR60_35750 [Inquilinus limosus]
MPEDRKARAPKARAIDVALEVSGIDEALTFYGRLFDFTLRGRSDGMALIDLGGQFSEKRANVYCDIRIFCEVCAELFRQAREEANL